MVNWKYILLALAVIAAGIGLYIWSRRKSLSFDFDLGGNLQNLLGAVQGQYADPNTRGVGIYVDVPLTTIIKNKSAGATVLQNILGSLSYDGRPIIQTKADSTVLQNVTVPARGSAPVTDTVQFLINPSSIKFVSELVKGNKPLVKYNFATTILGKPYQFTNNVPVNKEASQNSAYYNGNDLFDSNANPLSGTRAVKCCTGCLEYSHTLTVDVGSYPAGTKVYKCMKNCGCDEFR